MARGALTFHARDAVAALLRQAPTVRWVFTRPDSSHGWRLVNALGFTAVGEGSEIWVVKRRTFESTLIADR